MWHVLLTVRVDYFARDEYGVPGLSVFASCLQYRYRQAGSAVLDLFVFICRVLLAFPL